MMCFFYFVVCPLLVLWYFIQFQQYLRVFDPIPLGLPSLDRRFQFLTFFLR